MLSPINIKMVIYQMRLQLDIFEIYIYWKILIKYVMYVWLHDCMFMTKC